jgi:predicted DNA-binding transcriptional regulator AlpA
MCSRARVLGISRVDGGDGEVQVHPGDDRLVSAVEIAQRLGLKDGQTVLDLRHHQVGFPSPVARRSRSLVWSWDDVQTWVFGTEGMVAGTIGAALSTYVDGLV